MSNQRRASLFTPIKVGKHIYKNRLVASPMGGAMIIDGEIARFAADSAVYRSGGGVAEFCVGETDISPKGARSGQSGYDFFDWSEENLRIFKEYTDRIHKNNVVLLTELIHVGDSKTEATPECPAMSASAHVNYYGIPVVEMDEAMIADACDEYGRAARFMQLAGFDGVIPHFGHGWLPAQFLSPLSNHRTDRFGGSIENRSRISCMILESIRKYCGDDFLIEARISGSDMLDGSYTQEDIVGFCKCIAPYVNIIHVSVGHYRDPLHTRMVSTTYHEHGCNAYLAAAIKAAVPDVVVSVVGGVNSPEVAEKIVAEGQADLVVIARQSMADPKFPRKIEEGREDEIIPCTRCMRCFPGPAEEAFAEGAMVDGCSVNPMWDRLELMEAPAPTEIKRVLVVGGGPAGMQAAITARERGHEVMLLEKSDQLGGVLNYTERDEGKYDYKRYVDALGVNLCRSGCDVRMNTELTPAIRDAFRPDVIYIAIGSEPVAPAISGAEKAIYVTEAYEKAKDKKNIAVMAGDAAACEFAVQMAKEGKNVWVISDGSHELAWDGYRLHKHMLWELLAKETTVMEGFRWIDMDESGVRIADADGKEKRIAADLVVYSGDRRSKDVQAVQAAAGDTPTELLGDCKTPGKLYDATSDGFIAAFDLGWGGYEEYMESLAQDLPFDMPEEPISQTHTDI